MWSTAYGLDIETDTTDLTAEEIAAGYAPGSRGLDPRIGAVINAAVTGKNGAEVFNGTEAQVLASLEELFFYSEPGIIFTWNGGAFDVPFLAHRYSVNEVPTSLKHRLDEGLPVKYAPLPITTGAHAAVWENMSHVPHAHLDIAPMYRQDAERLGVAWSLKPVATALGVNMIEVDREKIHLLSVEEQDAYVASDAHGTRRLGMYRLGMSD